MKAITLQVCLLSLYVPTFCHFASSSRHSPTNLSIEGDSTATLNEPPSFHVFFIERLA